jgi:hypothetical protein
MKRNKVENVPLVTSVPLVSYVPLVILVPHIQIVTKKYFPENFFYSESHRTFVMSN